VEDKAGGVRWRGSTYAAVAVGGGKVTGYDWNTGAKLWETKAGSKLVSHDAGDYVVLIDAKKKKNDVYLPPFKVSVVDGKTGKIVWTMKDLAKKQIVNYSFPVPGQIRLVSKKGVVANLNLSDGRPGLPPAEVWKQRFVGTPMVRNDSSAAILQATSCGRATRRFPSGPPSR
jgi:outer membrane protein assembly factor BamB